MSRLKVIWLTCAGLLFSLSCLAQLDKREAIESVIELIAETNEDEELDYTTMLDALNDLYDNPIDLNQASSDELKATYLLTDQQVLALERHLEKHGRLLSIFELQAVEGYDLQTIRSLLPFVSVGRGIDAISITPAEIWNRGKHEVFLRWSRVIEQQVGYEALTDADFVYDSLSQSYVRVNENSRYLGSPDKLYFRYRFSYSNKLSIGLTGEKDAGEEFFKGSQKSGFDFYSAHIFLKDFGRLKRLAIGDFHAQFGQGLTLWSGLAYGKSTNVLGLKRNPQGIRKYTSVDENLFLRGAAATYEFGDIDVTFLASRKGRDANIVDTLDNELVVSSLQTSGVHARPRDLIDKDAIEETVIGANANYSKQAFSIGVTGVRTMLSGSLQRNLQLYQQFDFNANENTVVGLDFNATLRNINFFGEISRSDNGAMSYLSGAMLAIDPKLTLTAFHRNYDKDFQSVWGNATGENTRNANEQGLLYGMIFRPSKSWTVTGYFDRFKSDWLRFRTDGPSRGYEAICQAQWRPSKKTDIYFRYRHRDRPRNADIESPIDLVAHAVQNNYRVNATYKVSESVQLRNRLEWTDFSLEGRDTERGFLMYQDVKYKAKGSPFSLTMRYALFDTDSYDSRIYAYENDVLYYFSIPGFSGTGARYYAVGRYTFSRNIDLWVKYSRLVYSDPGTSILTIVGSDLNLIQDNKRSEIRVQMRFRF